MLDSTAREADHEVEDRIAKFLQSRWRMVALVTITAVVGLLTTDGMLRLRIESDIDKLFRTPDPTMDRFKQRFSLTDDDVYIILQSQQDLLQPDVMTTIRDIQIAVGQITGVRDTLSLLSLRSKRRAGRYLLPLLSNAALAPDRWSTTRGEVLQHPLAIGHLVSEDLRATVIAVRIDPNHEEITQLRAIITQLEQVVDQHLGELDPRYEMRDMVAGYSPLHGEIHTLMKRDQRIFITGGILLAGIIGWWLFRNLYCVVVVSAGPVMGAVVTLSVMGLFDIPITVMNTITPVIVIVVGYADSVHLTMEIRKQLESDADPSRAIAVAVCRIWLPCFLTSVTTAIGFGSLAISRVVAVREFGEITAFGCLVNFFAVQSILPVLASYWADRIRVPIESTGRIGQERFQTTSNRIASFVHQRVGWLATVGCAITFVSGVLCLSLRSENRLADYLPPASRALESYFVMQDQFGGSGSVYALIEWDESLQINSPTVIDALEQTQQIMSNELRFGPPLSLLDLLHSLPGRTTAAQNYRQQFAHLKLVPREYLRAFVSLEHRQTAIGARIADIGAEALKHVVDSLQPRLDAIERNGVTTTLVGPTVSMSRSFLELIRDLGWSLALATFLIFLIMSWLFRSLGLGLISALPNALALMGVGAGLVLADTPLQMVSVLCFTICLGISVDDTIHFLLRYLRHRRTGEPTTTATVNSIREIGPALIVSTIVFVGGIALVLLSKIPVLTTFAWLSCLSLMLALIANLFFLPALVIRLSRK